jgi:hypothetical protein
MQAEANVRRSAGFRRSQWLRCAERDCFASLAMTKRRPTQNQVRGWLSPGLACFALALSMSLKAENILRICGGL